MHGLRVLGFLAIAFVAALALTGLTISAVLIHRQAAREREIERDVEEFPRDE